MKNALFLLLPCLAACVLSCERTPTDEPVPEKKPAGETVWLDSARVRKQVEVVDAYKAPQPPFAYNFTYEYLPGNFCNPERGAYHPHELHFRKDVPPKAHTVADLTSARGWNCTLTYLGLYFMDYMYEDLPASVLQTVREEFENVRQAGTKLVLRHAYSWNSNVGEQEPPVGWILRHIKQMKPLLQEYYDIIYVVQAGFIGTYGEWAFRSNVSGDIQDRMVVDALMDALPASRQIAIRTPKHSMDMYKLTLQDTLTRETAFNGSVHARLAGHNDCFLANGNDAGTFAGAKERAFWLQDTRFMSMGGEGCLPNDDLCGCVNSYQQLKDYHWSYLSPGPVAAYWEDEGCKEDVLARIGYRFVLNGLAVEGDFAPGKDFTLKLCLTNYGFASLINPRPLQFIVHREENPSEQYVFTSETDPRIWEGCNTYVHTETLRLPEGLHPGDYTLYLNLPDESSHLCKDPRYSVRFANKGVWEEATGYNRLATVQYAVE